MKRLSLFVIALMFCAIVSVGCVGGGGNDSANSEQTESLNEETGGEDTTYDPNEEGRSYGQDDNYVTVKIYRNEILNYYSFKHLYGRKSSGDWVKLVDVETHASIYTPYVFSKANDVISDHEDIFEWFVRVPKDYVEFGFEFDQKDGTDWPYSDVFWTVDDAKREQARNIRIDTGGGIRSASIYIEVNGRVVVDKKNCFSGERYDWSSSGPGLSDKIKVTIMQNGGGFVARNANFWGRKAGGTWETSFMSNETVSAEYVDFGFEYDTVSSTDPWPYSKPFWIGAEHPGCRVTSISITIGGWLWIFGSTHIDITVMGYDANGHYGTRYTYSNHALDYEPNTGTRYNWN